MMTDPANQDRFRSAFLAAPIAQLLITPEERIADANPAAAALLGYGDTERLQGLAWADLFADPADHDRWRRGGDLVRGLETQLRRCDGTGVAWVEISSAAVRERGRLLFHAASAKDIAKRRHMEVALRANRCVMQGVFASIPDMLIIRDLDGRIVLVNDAAAAFMGRSTSEMIGKLPSDLASKELAEASRAQDLEVLRTGQAQVFHVAREFGGRTEHYLVSKGPFHDTDGRPVGTVSISRNVTEEREAQARLQAARAQREVFFKERVRRISQIVHEMDLIGHDGGAGPASAVPDLSALSAREWEVLRQFLARRRGPAIARALGISPNTVRNHLKSIYRKLGVACQDDLIEILSDVPLDRG